MTDKCQQGFPPGTLPSRPFVHLSIDDGDIGRTEEPDAPLTVGEDRLRVWDTLRPVERDMGAKEGVDSDGIPITSGCIGLSTTLQSQCSNYALAKCFGGLTPLG